MKEKLLDISNAQSHYVELENFVLSEYGALTAIVACVSAYIYVKLYWKSKRKPVFKRSKSLGQLYGGELALQRLCDYNEANVNPATLDNTVVLLKALLEEEHLDLKKLQTTLAKLEMSGREAEAVSALRKAKRTHAGKPHQLYEIEMLLVEMLIYSTKTKLKPDQIVMGTIMMGKFKEALECECLKHEEIVDARRPLFKAVLNKIQGNSEEAKKCWEEFTDIRRQFIDLERVEGADEQTINDFKQFKRKVQDIRHAIEEAQTATAKNKKNSQK